MSRRPYRVVDVFGAAPLAGNPVAVVHAADGLDAAAMQAFARWTNLSETTFLLRPTQPGSDYRVRIWTPGGELPFAGHPTLGTCHAWLEAGGRPSRAGTVVQACEAGLVDVLVKDDGLSFLAPPLVQSPIADDVRSRLCAALGVDPNAVVDARSLRNGPDWWTLLLDSAARVLAIEPDAKAMQAFASVGVVGSHAPGGATAFEVRGFVGGRAPYEDPVTGSLNAGIGEWLTSTGRAPGAYVASQGARLGRDGRVRIARRADGRLAVGGATRTLVEGTVDL